jgi:hypothetical protein
MSLLIMYTTCVGGHSSRTQQQKATEQAAMHAVQTNEGSCAQQVYHAMRQKQTSLAPLPQPGHSRHCECNTINRSGPHLLVDDLVRPVDVPGGGLSAELIQSLS